jgi:hypothetical protein
LTSRACADRIGTLRINPERQAPLPGELPLALQTAYADLVDRAAAAAFDEAFPEDGAFTPKTVNGRRYWYFQGSTAGDRKQQYAGPETPDLLARIARHRAERASLRERQTLVSLLVRSAHLPRPLPQNGEIVAALAAAGVFRLRGVLVGTVAYQTYPAMLGVRLPGSALQTADVDVAQFADVSARLGDSTPAMIDVLRRVDATFRPVPHIQRQRVWSYRTASDIRVEFLTPNKGRDTDDLKALPAPGTDARQFRFLDFLLADPEPAVLLHGAVIYVTVPAPQRYAVHKLIVSRRRRSGEAKQEKDLWQALALLDVLSRKRPIELRAAWHEAYARGKIWQQLLGEALGLIHPPDIRDRTLRTVGATRSTIPGLDLTFAAPAAGYDAERDAVVFFGHTSLTGQAGRESVRCAITREALEDHFQASGVDQPGRVRIFRENRTVIAQFARTKYLHWPIEEPGNVLIGTEDVAQLLHSPMQNQAGGVTPPKATTARRRRGTPPG